MKFFDVRVSRTIALLSATASTHSTGMKGLTESGREYRRFRLSNATYACRVLTRLKKSWRPAASLYCRFLILTQVVASGVNLAFACFATTTSMSRSQITWNSFVPLVA